MFRRLKNIMFPVNKRRRLDAVIEDATHERECYRALMEEQKRELQERTHAVAQVVHYLELKKKLNSLRNMHDMNSGESTT